jgi:hypothetical protein
MVGLPMKNLGRGEMPKISVFLNIPSLLGLTLVAAEQCIVLIYINILCGRMYNFCNDKPDLHKVTTGL